MWKDLFLEDKSVIDSWFHRFPCGLSDYTFTNLWIWNALRHYQYRIIENCLCIRFLDHGKDTYLMPIGEAFSSILVDHLIEEMLQFRMRAVSEEKLTALKELLPQNFTVTAEKDRFDYLYLFEELLSLKGNKLQAKRNLVHQFEEQYDYEYRPIDLTLLPAVIKMHSTFPETETTQAELRALHDFPSLAIEGGALLVDEKVIAYTLAEKLTPDTLVIHEEKALKEFKGAYQAINEFFLSHTQPLTFVNREEDLGLPALEQAKQSYHPIKLVKKFLISL